MGSTSSGAASRVRAVSTSCNVGIPPDRTPPVNHPPATGRMAPPAQLGVPARSPHSEPVLRVGAPLRTGTPSWYSELGLGYNDRLSCTSLWWAQVCSARGLHISWRLPG